MKYTLSFFIRLLTPGVKVQPSQQLPDDGKSTYFLREAWMTEEIEQLGVRTIHIVDRFAKPVCLLVCK
jgi:hypothetical protein